MNDIKETLTKDLKEAMQQKNSVAINAIRTLRARIDNAEAPILPEPLSLQMAGGIAGATEGLGSTEVRRKELSTEDIQEIIRQEIEDSEKMLSVLRDNALPDTECFAEQVAVLRSYLK